MEKSCKKPFDEVCFSLLGKELYISSPWASIEAEIEEKFLTADDFAVPMAYQNDNIQGLLEHLQDYCLSYDMPRTNLLKEKFFDGPETILCDHQDILKGRLPNGSYDPLTVFQFLQKEALVNQSKTHNCVYEALEDILKKSPLKFKKCLIFLLNQTYYITENFPQAIHPDQKMAQGLSEVAHEIYREEIGHHKLILESLNALGVDPDSTQVSAATKELIHIVSQGFQHSALGFALVNGALEGNHYPAEDPLSKIIKGSPFKKAAQGIDQHFLINKRGNHKDTSINIVTSMTHYVGEQEVSYVLNLSHRLQKTFFNIDKDVIDLIKQETIK